VKEREAQGNSEHDSVRVCKNMRKRKQGWQDIKNKLEIVK
jgi:hypothetical protein